MGSKDAPQKMQFLGATKMLICFVLICFISELSRLKKGGGGKSNSIRFFSVAHHPKALEGSKIEVAARSSKSHQILNL